jgi:hypothetical protein
MLCIFSQGKELQSKINQRIFDALKLEKGGEGQIRAPNQPIS